jgi:ubiquinone/menaquinone biosynthesis C-methylase UbiE
MDRNEERIRMEFNRYAHPNMVLRRYHLKRLTMVVDLLKRVDKPRNQIETVFLDVGCGDGTYEVALEKNFSYLVGLDVTRQNLRNAEQAVNDEGKVDFVLADVEHLPFKDMSTDVVLCSEVLEHVNDPSEALSELSRVSKHALVVTVPILNVLRRVRVIQCCTKLDRIESDIGHVNMHERSWWLSAICEAVGRRGNGYEMKTVYVYVSSEPFTSIFASLNDSLAYAFLDKVLGVLESFLSRAMFANHLIVVLTAR